MQNKILLVEDSPEFQKMVRSSLGIKYELDVATSVEMARRKVEQGEYNLIIMDVGLPDGSGFDLFRDLQNELEVQQTPVIFLTGKSDLSDKMIGFALGADDYLTKPFDPAELLLRVDSRIMKSQKKKYLAENLKRGPLRFDISHLSLFVRSEDGAEQRADVTPLEFKILLRLARNGNSVTSRQELLDGVWGRDIFIEDRSIDKHICAIRKKIKPYGKNIRTVSGVGYEFQY